MGLYAAKCIEIFREGDSVELSIVLHHAFIFFQKQTLRCFLLDATFILSFYIVSVFVVCICPVTKTDQFQLKYMDIFPIKVSQSK